MVCFPWFPIFRMFLTGTLETECRGNAWCVTQSSINLWAEPAHPCQDLAPCDYTLSLDLGALNIPKKEKRGCNLRVSFRISQIIWAFTHKISYTQQAFTHKIFYTQQAFTHRTLTHSAFTHGKRMGCMENWSEVMEIVAPSSKKRLGNAKSLQIFRTTCEEARRVSARDGGRWNPTQPCRAAGIRAERERQKPGAVVLAEARQSSLLTCAASSHVLLDCWDLLASSLFLQGQAMAAAALSPHGQRAWGIKRKSWALRSGPSWTWACW